MGGLLVHTSDSHTTTLRGVVIGEYKTIDIEKTLFEADRVTKNILKQL